MIDVKKFPLDAIYVEVGDDLSVRVAPAFMTKPYKEVESVPQEGLEPSESDDLENRVEYVVPNWCDSPTASSDKPISVMYLPSRAYHGSLPYRNLNTLTYCRSGVVHGLFEDYATLSDACRRCVRSIYDSRRSEFESFRSNTVEVLSSLARLKRRAEEGVRKERDAQ